MKSTHGRNVLQPSYQSFSPEAKPMLYVEKSPISSSRKASQFQRHGNVYKNIYQIALTME
jgi:hypothetical protein